MELWAVRTVYTDMHSIRPPIVEDLGRASAIGAIMASALGYPAFVLGWAMSGGSVLASVQWFGSVGLFGVFALLMASIAVWCASALYGDGIDGTEIARHVGGMAAAACVSAAPLLLAAGYGFVSVLA